MIELKLPEQLAGWEITDELGEGAYGSVYQIEKGGECCALKVISFPHDEGERRMQLKALKDPEAVSEYFKAQAEACLVEESMQVGLSHCENVVAIYDNYLIPMEDAVGWNAFIRMELLTDLQDELDMNGVDEKKVLNIAMQLSNALICCEKAGILHRDIKPENILVSDSGVYKLGDFGLARRLESSIGSLSLKGTFDYMSPEIYHGRHYGKQADLYSLGMVLYRLLNKNRGPFIPLDKQLITFRDKEEAMEKRMRGDKLPAPAEASPEMADIILRLSAFKPEERFKNAAELRKALIDLSQGRYVIRKAGEKPVEAGPSGVNLPKIASQPYTGAQNVRQPNAGAQNVRPQNIPPQNIGSQNARPPYAGTQNVRPQNNGSQTIQQTYTGTQNVRPQNNRPVAPSPASAQKKSRLPLIIAGVSLTAVLACGGIGTAFVVHQVKNSGNPIQKLLEQTDKKPAEPKQTEAAVRPQESAYYFKDHAFGAGLTTSLTTDGVLTVSGTGSMFKTRSIYDPTIVDPDDGLHGYAWDDYSALVKELIFEANSDIYSNAFDDMSALTRVTITGNVQSISYSAFTNCKNLEEVIIPDCVEAIGYNAFANCPKLAKVTLPENVQLEQGVFKGTEFLRQKAAENNGFAVVNGILCYYKGNDSKVVIPDSVKEIENTCFYGNQNIKSVVIPKSVTKIGKNAFMGCSNLSKVDIKNPKCEIQVDAFKGTAWKQK